MRKLRPQFLALSYEVIDGVDGLDGVGKDRETARVVGRGNKVLAEQLFVLG